MRGFWLALLIFAGAAASHAGAQAVTPLPVPASSPSHVVDCEPNPFIVFFEWNEDGVSEISRRILGGALDQFRSPDCPWTHAIVVGHADRSGPAAANFSLSRRRATAIARYLTDRGVPAAVVTTQAFGEDRPIIDTADGVQEPQNRRVEIFFRPHPAGN